MGDATVSDRTAGGTVADRLRQARARSFVGRQGELELFRTAIESTPPPFTVLYIHGPGGVGKTALLHAYAMAAEAAGRHPVSVDAHTFEPSPAGFLNAVGGSRRESGVEGPADDGRLVLLIDTYESAAPIDDWLREHFLPGLPAGAIVVLAGRDRPGAAWRADLGWHDLLRVMSLRNLRPEDTVAYLRAARVPEVLHADVLGFTHGHPLALSLVADVLAQEGASWTAFEPSKAPDVIGQLLERFASNVPGPAHRLALEASAHVRQMTEPLLRAALDQPDVHDIFSWLRGLSFIEPGPSGVFPHDLVRDVLDMDLWWRDRQGYVAMHRRTKAHLVDQIHGRTGHDQQQAMLDLMYAHRTNPVARPYWEWASFGHVFADPLVRLDRPAVLDTTRQHEGDESAVLVEHWLDCQPGAFVGFRDGRGDLRGYLAILDLTAATDDQIARDPGTRAVWTFAQRHAPPRSGEHVTHFRFLVDRETHQRASAGVNLASVRCLRNWLLTPRLAWDFISVFEPDYWERLLTYLDYHRVPDADFAVGMTRHTTFGHDWRQVPVNAWLDLMADRELDREFGTVEAVAEPAPLLALSRPEFDTAIKQALRDLHRPDRLAANPLLRSRLVLERSGGGSPVEVLQQLLIGAASTLRDHPRDERLFRAVDRTYLRPAPTQERAAEVLGLPFSTYRHHLAEGVARVSALLWDQDVYGPARSDGEQKLGSYRSGV